MAYFKFIHAADLHIDSPLRGLEQYDDAPLERIRSASRQALENLVQLAIDQRVAFVLIAGDLYDGDWPDYNTGLFVVRQLARLQEAGIAVVMIAGNHDAQNRMTKALRLPPNVHMLPSDEPGSHRFDDWDVVVHGQGFATQAVTKDLSAGYAMGLRGCFNIGLLHTCATGRDGHERYAPCTLDGLRSKEYDYWALGHVHNRETLCEGNPWVVFPGNTQGRHIREAGPKGCVLVTVATDRRAYVEFHPLCVLRWERCSLDASGAQTGDDLLNLFSDGLQKITAGCGDVPLAVRVELTGRCPAHQELASQPERWKNELRSAATIASGGSAWVEKVKIKTGLPEHVGGTLSHDSPLGALWELFQEYQDDEDRLRKLGGELADLKSKLPPELREGRDAMELDSPLRLRELLGDVQHLLIGRLLAQGSKP